MLRRIRASEPWEPAIACGLVALAGVAAWVSLAAIGLLGCAMILLAPIVIAGSLYGVRTALTAAGLAYLVFALLVAEPLLPSTLGAVGRHLTPPVFIFAALIAGGVARILRASPRSEASSSQTTRAVIDATAFFKVTPNEDAIRQKLAETVSAMTRTATVVTDRDGRLRFFAGAGSDRIGPVGQELENLVGVMLRQPRNHSVTRGEFCARLIATPCEVQGVVIWRRPPRDRARMNAADEDVKLLVDLAGAALARSGRDSPVQEPQGL